ncbi:hypothetical protein C7S16_2022 [Burkholderia thailandensis]|uniref:Uncharacterized protein n=1 Tax=Burkholderia thailandensis TaxID=57975 RepID=A0AAW9CXV5_BURTH|nr:hypothetical protein [Burkholderia thailandensis]MDW9254967.1 hypothetical protein [Burkholderia thailandensis]
MASAAPAGFCGPAGAALNQSQDFTGSERSRCARFARRH